jgi:hypothetical protein
MTADSTITTSSPSGVEQHPDTHKYRAVREQWRGPWRKMYAVAKQDGLTRDRRRTPLT